MSIQTFSKFNAHVTMRLKLKDMVLSEKKSQKQTRFREYHLCESNTHSTTITVQV